ncbi:GreA/GreB family elongation factor [Lysobacter cavernae]|uniref:GreA/GreB family elongation factor n=1 Tax=Lysobacter cavernae TaxID=1685901 RepID=A0ABV7RLG4_9GAMM
MSRAFVKEHDDDAGDLPELPLSEHSNYVTSRGLAQLRARLGDAAQRFDAITDDAADAKLLRAHLARELRWLQARIAGAIPVATENQPPDRVGFGATVELVDDDGQTYRYRIVGEDEADPEHALVSWVSPLARALSGARVGDTVVWLRPAGDLNIEVMAIDYAPGADA